MLCESAHTDMGIHRYKEFRVRLKIQQHDMCSLLCALNFLIAVCRITSFQFTIISIPTTFDIRWTFSGQHNNYNSPFTNGGKLGLSKAPKSLDDILLTLLPL